VRRQATARMVSKSQKASRGKGAEALIERLLMFSTTSSYGSLCDQNSGVRRHSSAMEVARDAAVTGHLKS
jgi:hypothetical protein